MNIIITGSVCTGKTTLAKILSRILHYKHINVNGIIKTHKEVVAGYDRKRKTKEIDTNKLNKVLLKIIKKQLQPLLSHILKSEGAHSLKDKPKRSAKQA